MRIVRRGEGKASRWKNGGGVTWEVAVHPDGAAFDAFDWRLSMAEVAADGPFSAFPGVDRTLTLIEGAGMALDFGGGTVDLGPGSAPLSFPGEAPVTARLSAGPILDFNVMTRRAAAVHRVQMMDVPGPEVSDVAVPRLELPHGTRAILCRHGAVSLGGHALNPGDCALLEPGQPAPSLGGAGLIITIVIDLMDDNRAGGEYPGATREGGKP